MGERRVVMPGVIDRHVHLGLVDGSRLRDTAVVEVHDLGWSSDPALRWRREGVGGAAVRVVGPFLTPVGGFPKGRPWAPDAAVREIGDIPAARAAVLAAVVQRLDAVGIVLHAESSTFDDRVLLALVGGAHESGLEVVAHVEGPGQVQRALDVGVDVFAHVPWTERLDDWQILACAARCTWISTLAVHDGEDRRIAIANARRFVAAGGRLRYGTDLGIGAGPVDVRRDEVLALGETGLWGAALIEVLTGWTGGPVDPEAAVAGDGPVPPDAEGIADWYLAARRVTVELAAAGERSPAERAEELDAEDPVRPLRSRFVRSSQVVAYLDGNSLGRPLERTPTGLAQLARARWGGRLIRGWDEGWMEEPERLGDELGRVVLGAGPGQTVVGDSTSVLLYKAVRAAAALDPARTELVHSAGDFPTDRFVLQGIADELGLTLVPIVTAHDGGVEVDQVAAAVGPATAAVVLSHVAYRSAHVTDVAAVTAVAHEAGARTVWDLSHSVGALPLRLDAWQVDLAVGCTYKYLNGGPGAPAFLFARRDLLPRLRQPIQGWMGADEPFEMGEQYRPDPGIRRFLSGTPSIVAMLPIADMLAVIDQVGIDAVRRKSEQLTAYAIDRFDTELAPLGVRLATPRDPARRGSHVTLDHPAFQELVPVLHARGVIPDFRRPDGLRIGLSPLSTSFAELEAGLSAIREEFVRRVRSP